MRVLAIDQGTTSTRGLVFEGDAPPQVVASLRHRQIYPQPGWVEQDPLEICENVRACIAAAGPVDAIGLANQGESCLAWDAETKAPLSPIIVWQDDRTTEWIEALKAQGHEAWVRDRTGLPLDCYFSASKLGWILRECPEARAAFAANRLRLGTTDAFLLDSLTDTFATDISTASRTALMRLADGAWDPELCALFGVPIETLPPIRRTDAGFGAIDGTPVQASVVDQQAALCGHGARAPGDTKITFGTGAFALVHAGLSPPSAQADGLIATVAWGDASGVHYALEGGVYDAGAAIDWARRIGLIDDAALLDRWSGPPAVEAGLLFVPALSGLACPHWRRDASGSWSGMTTATTRADLQRSILEGIALQTAEVIATFDRRILLGEISVDGGLSANDGFLQFLADASGRRIRRAGSPELTAYGCARLAGHRGAAPASGAVFVPEISDERRRAWQARYAKAVARALP